MSGTPHDDDVFIARASRAQDVGGARLTIYSTFVVIIRGLALWVIVPLTTLLWLLAMPVRVLRRTMWGRKHPRLRQYIAWADEMFIAILETSILRPLGVRNGFPPWPRPGDADRKGSITDAW